MSGAELNTADPVVKGRPLDQPLVMRDVSGESVVVTHVESPEKFYCRLASDGTRWTALNDLILARVAGTVTALLAPAVPASDSLSPDDHLLAYSTIHQQWCRCRVQRVEKDPVVAGVGVRKSPVDRPVPSVSVRVSLIDYGSVEVVSVVNLRESDEEIIGFNNGHGFCFECRLWPVKPLAAAEGQWSSYANYLFERCTKGRAVELLFRRYDEPTGAVVCDLRSVASGKDCVHSLADHLVATRVARYRMGEGFYHRVFPDDDDRHNDWHSDEEDGPIAGDGVDTNSDKLYFI